MKKTQQGLNKTGIATSPVDSKDVYREVEKRLPNPTRDNRDFDRIHIQRIQEADPVGTVPLPGTLKGAVKSTAQRLMGHRPETLIDKLGERLAFERTGTRLYDALITRFDAKGDPVIQGFSVDTLRRFRNEEARHMELLRATMENLGADPTAMTPSADVSGVTEEGVMKVLTDPRTTLAQSVSAILVAELADSASWELLTEMAQDLGHQSLANEFRNALHDEQNHLVVIRGLLQKLLQIESQQLAA